MWAVGKTYHFDYICRWILGKPGIRVLLASVCSPSKKFVCGDLAIFIGTGQRRANTLCSRLRIDLAFAFNHFAAKATVQLWERLRCVVVILAVRALVAVQPIKIG